MTGNQRRPQSRLLRGTIWDEKLLEEVPTRYRAIYTVVLPLTYLSFTLFGAAGFLTIVPSVAAITSPSYSDFWAALVGLLGLLNLIALVWRKERLELFGAIFLVAGLVTYPAGMLILALAGDIDRVALALGLPVFLYMVAWRVIDLVRTIRKRNEGRNV